MGFWGHLRFLSFAAVLHGTDDMRFIFKDGVIYDSQLGIQWVPANGQAMSHYHAEEYARNLSLAGGGWRLPTMAEVTSLLDFSQSNNVDPVFNINLDDPVFNTDLHEWTSEVYDVWTSEVYAADPSWAWLFDFGAGESDRGPRGEASYRSARVLAVRSRR